MTGAGSMDVVPFASIDSDETLLPAQELSKSTSSGSTYYVDQDATGENNGSSWTNAYNNVDTALQAATAGDQIWVAEGVYIPTIRLDPVDPKSASFALKNGVAVYGGFAGNETELAQRDWVKNITILSGDLGQDDVNVDGNFIAETDTDLQGTNTAHLVTVLNASSPTLLDGFTVTAGMGSSFVIGETDYYGNGGGLWAKNSGGLQLANLTFSGNAGFHGGAVYGYYHTQMMLNQVIFTGNEASRGGALYLEKELGCGYCRCDFLGELGTEQRWGDNSH